MSSASVKRSSAVAEMPNIVSGEKRDALLDGFRSLVSRRAYELFEELGRVDGNDVTHWLRAEGELCVRLPEVQESGAWYTVSAPVVGVPADHIKISVEDRGALISAEKPDSASDSSGENNEYSSIYYSVRWPESVDPETASAYLKNGALTLLARKAGMSNTESHTEIEKEASSSQATTKVRSSAKRGKR